jgi:hypothetical protein
MRKTFVLVVLIALALPVAALSAGLVSRAGDGTLTVEDGRGTVSVQARGGVIGRIDRGTVTIFDLTPEDDYDPVVFGDDQPIALVGDTGIRYRGTGIRYRLIGGSFRIVVNGRGIDLSVVGRGSGTLRGDTIAPGLYSLDGADCRKASDSCKPLPDVVKSFRLGGPENTKEKGGKPDRQP